MYSPKQHEDQAMRLTFALPNGWAIPEVPG
jgi:hypothetical protein